MYEVRFSVDTSVWQDGVTFASAIPTVQTANKAEQVAPTYNQQTKPVPSFQEELQKVAAVPEIKEIKKPIDITKQNIPEIPAALADVQDLTPFVVSADNAASFKPGNRLDDELKRTKFTQERKSLTETSPYNMSEARAKRREVAMAEREVRELKGVKNEKVFSMETVAHFNKSAMKPSFTTPQAPADNNRERAAEKLKNVNLQTALQKPVALSPVDVDQIRAQATATSGYPRDNMPSASNEKTSAAASWFPEAMTRQLDTYEAMKKVANQGAVAAQADIKV